MMELIILIISSILIFSGVASTAEELRFLSRETDSDGSEDLVQNAWLAFKTQHAKSYSSSEEDRRRRRVFEESLKIVQSHNYLYETGRTTYEMGINQFSDMEFSEIEKMTGYVETNATYTDTEEEISPPADNSVVPDTVDWRPKGYVTAVKNQAGCRSSWAFSATGSLEGQRKKKTGSLVSLSEQNLIDCSWAQGNKGCNGGSMKSAFDYIRKNGGIGTETYYPYEAKDAACRYRNYYPYLSGSTVRGHVFPKRGSEAELTKAVANVGPISVWIRVPASFIRYKTGFYQDSSDNKGYLYHALLVVGYGIDGERAYYVIKNSWGVTWGKQGYGQLPRNQGNMFGIANAAIYPVV